MDVFKRHELKIDDFNYLQRQLLLSMSALQQAYSEQMIQQQLVLGPESCDHCQLS